MRLIRRGGRRTNMQVATHDIGGNTHALRQQLHADDLENGVKPDLEWEAGARTPPELQISDNWAQPAQIEPKSVIAPVETLAPFRIKRGLNRGVGSGHVVHRSTWRYIGHRRHDDKEIPPETPHRFWRDIHIPMDFQEINFTAPEEPLRKLVELPAQRTEDQLVALLHVSMMRR